MKNYLLIVLCVLTGLPVLLDSCSSSAPTAETDQDETDDAIIQQYLADSGITNATADPSGIYFYPVNELSGTSVASGDVLSIFFIAQALGNQPFEQVTIADGDNPVKLQQGVQAVYPEGLDIGLANMREGDTFVFLIPSSLAYGPLSPLSIVPENAVIKIEVTLDAVLNQGDILSQEQNLISDFITANDLNDTIANPVSVVKPLLSGIFYKRRRVGTANDVLAPGDSTSFSYRGLFLDDLNSPFDATAAGETFDYIFMSGLIIPGIEAGLDVMERNEEAWLILPSALAYRESAFVIPSSFKQNLVDLQIIPQYAAKVPPYTVVIFETTLR